MNNNWINHIKQYALKNNIKYSEALKDPNAKASYGGSLKSDTVKRILHFNKEHFNPFDVYKPSKDIQSMILSGYTKGQYTDQNFNVAIANERNKEHIKLLKELWKTAKDNKNKKTVTLKSTPNYDELLNDVGNMKKIKTNKTSNNEDEKEKKKLDLRKGRMQKKIADWRRRLPRYWSNDADIYEGTSNASIEKLIQMEKEALDEVIKYEAEQERSNLNDVRNTKKIKTNKKTVTLKNIPNHDQLLNDVGNMKQIKITKNNQKMNTIKTVVDNIQLFLKYLYSSRKSLFNDDAKMNKFDKIVKAIEIYDFYPTPPQYGNIICKAINDFFRENNNDRINILDLCCGFGSLTMPFIDNYLQSNDTIYLSDINEDMTDILKPLNQLKNIVVKTEDILNTYKTYYNKNINAIVCNPPFSLNLNNGKADYKYGYLFFLYVCLEIMANNAGVTHCYFICPKTLFKTHNDMSVELNVPDATIKLICKYMNIDYDEYLFSSLRGHFLSDVVGFKTIRKGQPTNMGLTCGLYHFENINYSKNNQKSARSSYD